MGALCSCCHRNDASKEKDKELNTDLNPTIHNSESIVDSTKPLETNPEMNIGSTVTNTIEGDRLLGDASASHLPLKNKLNEGEAANNENLEGESKPEGEVKLEAESPRNAKGTKSPKSPKKKEKKGDKADEKADKPEEKTDKVEEKVEKVEKVEKAEKEKSPKKSPKKGDKADKADKAEKGPEKAKSPDKAKTSFMPTLLNLNKDAIIKEKELAEEKKDKIEKLTLSLELQNMTKYLDKEFVLELLFSTSDDEEGYFTLGNTASYKPDKNIIVFAENFEVYYLFARNQKIKLIIYNSSGTKTEVIVNIAKVVKKKFEPCYIPVNLAENSKVEFTAAKDQVKKADVSQIMLNFKRQTK